jgi:DNA helicase HerA-like ATPase
MELDHQSEFDQVVSSAAQGMDVGSSALVLPSTSPWPDSVRSAFDAESKKLNCNKLVGLVAVDSDISKLHFEVVRTDLDLEEGKLVEVRIGRQTVLYQVINGLTKEEIVQQKNKFGYVRADAKKIGTWDSDKGRFEVVRWVPNLNEPVFIVEAEQFAPKLDAIGHFPGTSHSVRVDLNQVVTHNTAILGILGVGKTFLALELVERLVKEQIKVVCLDLTNQYANELGPLYDAAAENAKLATIAQVGANGRTNVQQNVEEGGSVGRFQEAVRNDLDAFLRDGQRFVKIYNPSTMEVWRQDSRPYQNRASMASLTPTEITRLITEPLLELLQGQMSEKARACIVFEEAHSLIPEWSAVASEGDKEATNGTAKAILQGRKYGLGCIVVTQRTANVTKTILNQCNTVFALRVFDATGMEFLKNYIGEDYAAVLSTLEDRHAVVFGRASSCRNPVLVRLNDRPDFLKLFRQPAEAAAAPASVES